MPMKRRAKRITPHQAHILDLMAAGLTNREIAAQVGIAESTVKTHLHRAYSTLGAKRRAQAAIIWREHRPPQAGEEASSQ